MALKDVLSAKSSRNKTEMPKAKYPIVIPFAADEGKTYNAICKEVGLSENSDAAVLGARMWEIIQKAQEAELF